MQAKKNTFITMLVAGSLLLSSGIAKAETTVHTNVDPNQQLMMALDIVDVKQELNQTLVQLQLQLKQDSYNNAHKALTEKSLQNNELPLLQH